MDNDLLLVVAETISDIYKRVATGETRGSQGSFYADGKGTLNAVSVPVDLLEKLQTALDREVYPRTIDFRKAQQGGEY